VSTGRLLTLGTALVAAQGASMDHSTVQLRTAEDVVLAAPLMLGYWPADSLCAIFVDAEDRVVCVMRWDVDAPIAMSAPPSATGLVSDPDSLPVAFHLVAFAAPGSRDPGQPERWFAAVDAWEAGGIPLGRLLLVAQQGDRIAWVQVVPPAESADEACQHMSATDIDEVATRWGIPHFRGSREEFVSDIAPDEAAMARVRSAIASLAGSGPVAEVRRDRAIRRVRRHLTGGVPNDEDIARVLIALGDVRVRDTVLWDVMHDNPRMWGVQAARLADIVSASPESHVPAPATLLAILRWQLGDGSRASAAIDRALGAEPGYVLAQLVQQCLASGMHPRTWREGLVDLSREACRRPA
jgi:hypothetical protein